MRLTVRKAVQGTAVFCSLVCLNILYQVSQQGGTEVGGPEFDGSYRHGRRAQFVQEPPDALDLVKTFNAVPGRRPRSAKGGLDDSHQRANASRSLTNVKVSDHNVDQSKSKGKKHRLTNLGDVYISVKTTQKYHQSRVKILLDTWVQLAREQTYFFTDTDDAELQKRTNGHMINTNCSGQHNRQALCCKMAQEYDYFLQSKKRWFCHIDDDTYVNVPELVRLLQQYNHTDDWYLGKPSLKHPIEIVDRENQGVKLAFWFATGGAGFCISRSLALKMSPHASGGRLMTVGEKIRLPDDCTIGYIIHHVLGKRLTVIQNLHSHLEALWLLRDGLSSQITFSYSQYGDKMNVVEVAGFDPSQDPTRLYSLHCHLFPYFKQCESLYKKQA
ncbi:fringe glycosyltransferase-like [Liolophura sinensis]|uniref:fringe glycosyltransferase-like n=1 Tax=Liolophura sinensis TaxID=3198878 RepID=UPI003158D7E4